MAWQWAGILRISTMVVAVVAGSAACASSKSASAEAAAVESAPHRAGEKSVNKTWPDLLPDEQSAAVKSLKAFAADVNQRMKISLSARETDFFLFNSDIPEEETKRWTSLLDEMYHKMAALLGVPKDQNIWRGKAITFVFRKRADYRRFQETIHETDPGKSAGMCHRFPDGSVHIAFYRQTDEKEFAHVLVHESVHGFLHRLKTPVEVPSWVDEGLAEVIASELSPQEGRAARTLDYAKEGIALNKGLVGMLEAEQIERWQYPVAQLLTELLMRRDKKAYAAFIDGIKAGMPWKDSLKKHFGWSEDQIIHEFAASLGVEDLRP